MSFFEDLGKKLNFAIGETASKTKEFAAVTKLNTSISARQHEIDDAYMEIGRAVFERESANSDSPVAALCAKIIANQECINDMKQQIVDLKNATIENRKARSETIFGQQSAEQPVQTEIPVEQPQETPAEAQPAEEAPAQPETPAEPQVDTEPEKPDDSTL